MLRILTVLLKDNFILWLNIVIFYSEQKVELYAQVGEMVLS